MPEEKEIASLKKSIADRKSRLDYVAELLDEIRKISLTLDEESLAYLVEVAMLEARLQSGLCERQIRMDKNP